MAAMAPALTDAPAEARHIRLKLAAESNSNSTNLLLSSSIPSSDTASSNGKHHHENNCHHCCNGKEALSEPLTRGKFQPLMASYLCSHVGPVAEESVLIKPSVLKSRGLLNGDLLLRTALSGGQPKSLVNGGGGTGAGGGNAMVPVNGLAKKAAVPSPALPEKGSVAPLNGGDAKRTIGAGALLPLSSKSGDVIPMVFLPRADSKHVRELIDLQSRAPENTGVKGPTDNTQFKSEMPPSGRSHSGRAGALPETNGTKSVPLDTLHNSTLCQHNSSPSSPSSDIEALILRERAQQSERRQADISARVQRLCKRLQVVQAKQVERHVKQQLSGFLHKSVSQSSTSKRDSMTRLLRNSSLPLELTKLHLSGTTNLRVAEAQFDTDATESSSGGESDVEEEELSRVDTEQRHVKLWRRAEGRFVLERAAIISRWTWLQAHISDLEYRIRQHTDIYRQIRASKGSVELGDHTYLSQIKTKKGKPQNSTEDISQVNRFQRERSRNELYHSMVEIPDYNLSLNPESDYSAARVRPLISCKRRCVLQPDMLQNRNSMRRCSLARPCDVNSVCVMCGGAQLNSNAGLTFDRPLVESLALQDPSVHPTLSLQSDMPLSIQLQRVLKVHWQTRSMEKVKPLKKLSLKHRLSRYSSSLAALSKHRFRLSSSPMTTKRFSSHRSRSETTRKQSEAGICLSKIDTSLPCRPGRHVDRSPSRKRARETLLDRTVSSKVQFDGGIHFPLSQPSTLTGISRQMCDSTTPLGPNIQAGSCTMPIRKRKSENSFDINNIVIPMSVAATTRVEKLQYKEIITPSWREAETFSQPLLEEDEFMQVEDLSDAMFMQLHQKYEDNERGRWRTTALTPAKRRGSRSYKSLDGRTTPSLSGTNSSTPQPSSPDMGNFHMLLDYGPIPSPLSPPSPDTPCSRDAHTPSSRDSYTPHMRDTPRLVYSEDTRCSTPEGTLEEKTVQPWERRNFPLSEDPVLEPKVDPGPHSGFSCGAESESETSSV